MCQLNRRIAGWSPQSFLFFFFSDQVRVFQVSGGSKPANVGWVLHPSYSISGDPWRWWLPVMRRSLEAFGFPWYFHVFPCISMIFDHGIQSQKTSSACENSRWICWKLFQFAAPSWTSASQDHWHCDLGHIDARSRGDPTSERPNNSAAMGFSRVRHQRHVRETYSDFGTVADLWLCDMWYVIWCLCEFVCFFNVFCSSLEVVGAKLLCKSCSMMLCSTFLSTKSWSMLVRSLVRRTFSHGWF